MLPIDAQSMLAIAPHFSGKPGDSQAHIVAAVGAVLRETLARYGIDTPQRIAHFLAQTCHESAGFRTTEEFASGEAYEGRKDLGNTQPGDGVRFKGRGLLQLTGRANYLAYGKALGVDLIAAPEKAAEPALSLAIACEFWKRHKINDAADRDDIEKVTRLINGGLNGLDDRTALTAKAKAMLAKLAGGKPVSAPVPAGQPVLKRGAKGDAVKALQAMLKALGHAVTPDGDFGGGTETAVKAFQASGGMDTDGVVGPGTWIALGIATGASAGAPAAATAAA